MSYLRLDHPNIIKYHATYEDKKQFYFVMEMCPKSLPDEMDQLSIKKLIIGMIHGMQHYFEMEVIHRDIKPDNVMIGSDGRVRIVDFGVSARIGAGSKITEAEVGTLNYMAPEVLMGIYT
jgi:serine/threonine protein kinase